MFIRLRILVLNVTAVVGATAALLPLLFRRGPIGHRTQVPRVEARIIPLPERRRATRL